MKKLTGITLLLLLVAAFSLTRSTPVQIPAIPPPVATIDGQHNEEPLILEIVATRGNRTITFGELTDELMKVDLVLVGESHDSALHHRVQLQIIKALYARDERLGVGMEMFQRPFQGAVDRFIGAQIGEAEFLRATEYQQRWGFDWRLYRPIVEFARRNEIPLAALNASKELTHRIMQVGYAGLTDAERKELGPVDFAVKAHHDFWYEALSTMHGSSPVSAEQKERTYQVMTVWDDYMAQSAAMFLKERHLARLVILAGIGHIDQGFGIPDRAAKYAGRSRATIGIVIGDSSEQDAPSTDYVIRILPSPQK